MYDHNVLQNSCILFNLCVGNLHPACQALEHYRTVFVINQINFRNNRRIDASHLIQ